jgi:hypothetical protein
LKGGCDFLAWQRANRGGKKKEKKNKIEYAINQLK